MQKLLLFSLLIGWVGHGNVCADTIGKRQPTLESVTFLAEDSGMIVEIDDLRVSAISQALTHPLANFTMQNLSELLNQEKSVYEFVQRTGALSVSPKNIADRCDTLDKAIPEYRIANSTFDQAIAALNKQSGGKFAIALAPKGDGPINLEIKNTDVRGVLTALAHATGAKSWAIVYLYDDKGVRFGKTPQLEMQ
jgi:hypothetical protein